MLHQRQAAHHPPYGGDQEGNDHGSGLSQAEAVGEQHHHQTDHKGNHGTDVTEGIALGRDLIHPLLGSDFGKHGVIEHQAGGITHLGNDENHQKSQPAPGKAQGSAADGTQQQTQQEDGLFEALLIRHGTADGTDDGHQQGGDGTGVTPVGQIIGLGHAAGSSQGIKVDGDQGGHQQDEGGVTHIVQDPAPFQGA